MVMTSVNKMVPPGTGEYSSNASIYRFLTFSPPDIAGAYESSSDSDQELILNLALFLTNFLSSHVQVLETEANHAVLLNAHLYLIKISQVEEREIFKICLEYWAKLVADLYDEMQKAPMGEMSNPLLHLSLGAPGVFGAAGQGATGRRALYTDVLSNLRLVMVERMAKPEEVSLAFLRANTGSIRLISPVQGSYCRER